MRARLAVLALVLGGCGGGDAATVPTAPTRTTAPTPAAESTPFSRALRPVRDSLPPRVGLVYGDEATLRRLAHAPRSVSALGSTQLDQRWFGLVGFGAPTFAVAAPQLPPVTGIDLFAAERAITIGAPPRSATRLDGPGLNTARIAAALAKLGARRTAGGLLALGREGEAHLTGPLGQLGLVTALDRAVVRPGLLVAGSSAAAVSDLLGGGPSILEDAGWAAAVRCLGDVVAAQVVPRGPLAVGVVRPAPHPRAVTERLCIVNHLDAARLRARLAHLPHVATVEVDTPAGATGATLTLEPSQPAGLLFRRLANGSLEKLLG